MATKIKAENATRRDVFYVNPFDIVVKEELRGRSTPPTEEQIVERADSMLDFGQIQPIEVRRVDSDGTMVLTLGFTRCAAARLIREGFVGLDGQHRQDPEYRLCVRVVDCNDAMAFKRNIVENAHRNETTPVDDAFNQDKLRQNHGMNDIEIARLYGEPNSNRVSKLRKLLILDKEIQDLVHQGRFPLDPAIDLLELPPEERAKVVAEATADGKVQGSVIRAQVRAHHLNDDGKPAAVSNGQVQGEGKKSFPLSMREIRKYLTAVKEGDKYDPAIIRFASDTLVWLAGKCTSKAMDNALNRLLEAKRQK